MSCTPSRLTYLYASLLFGEHVFREEDHWYEDDYCPQDAGVLQYTHQQEVAPEFRLGKLTRLEGPWLNSKRCNMI